MTSEPHSSDIDSVVMLKLWNGDSLQDEKDRKIMIKCSEDTMACGLTKQKVFQECVAPPLRSFYL